MTERLDGKVALVIGGTRGIGRDAVLGLAEAGATVIATGRKEAAAEEAAAAAREYGASAVAMALDVRDPAQSAAVADAAVERFERLDVVVANAGINPYFKRPEELTPEIWDDVMDVNLRGLFFAVQAAGRHMIQRHGGSIVSVSSVTGTVGAPRHLPYAASKGGLDAMTRTLAVDWAKHGIRVNAVAPGYVETDLTSGFRENERLSGWVLENTPLGRFARPEEIASLIVYLASDAASYITGQVYLIDGGFSAR
jgi:NAD(P)-dependent dehydrogenase (short-subunit alcohol dehydrogenase family)